MFGPTDSIATARWMEPDEVEDRFVWKDGDFWLGRNPYEFERPVGFSDDRHIMLIAGNRSGKGTSIIVPNLCLWPGSIVAIDPKGENAQLTARRRANGSEHCKGLGQKTYILDPFNVVPHAGDSFSDLKARFNPLDTLDPNSPKVLDAAGRIADAIVEIGKGDSKQWDQGARSLVRALILYVLTSKEFEGRRNLSTVRSLILRGDPQAAQAMREASGTKPPSNQACLWWKVKRSEALNGKLAEIAEGFFESAYYSPKQYNSYRIVAETSTEFLDSEDMAACLAQSDFSLSELKNDPDGVSIFLTLPDSEMSNHYRWLRMMVSLTITEMQKIRGLPSSGHRVLMCLDEFAGLGHMDIINRSVAQIAGFGLTFFFVLQSLKQLEGNYAETWETFLSQCGVRASFGTTDNFTNRYM